MFDLIQLKSGLGKEHLEKDIKYISDLTEIALYEYEHERLKNEFLDTLYEINNKAHIHLDYIAIDKITEEKIKSWNSSFLITLKKTSQLENDIGLTTKYYVDKTINKDLFKKDFIITSIDNKKWTLTIDDDGVLNTKEYKEG